MATQQKPDRVGWLKFALYAIVAIAVVFLATTTGRASASLHLSAETAIGLGFMLFLLHLAIMVPVELLYLSADRPELIKKPAELLKLSRSYRWTAAGIYGNVTTWCALAGLGIGLASVSEPTWASWVAALFLLGWHLFTKRAFCEHKGTPHLHQRPPFTVSEEICSWVADVPILLIVLWIWLASHQFIWVIAGIIVLSYSLLVRVGHWFRDYGPMSYVATLAGLIVGTVIVWPWGALQPDRWQSLPSGLLGGAAGVLSGFHAITKRIPRQERVVSGIFAAVFAAYAIGMWQTDATLDFSPGRLFGTTRWDASGALTVLAAFLIPFLGYVSVWTISEARDWLKKV